MTQALTKTERAGPLDALLSDVDRLKEFPIETVERMFALHRQHEQDAAQRAFNEAFHALQGELKPVRTNAENSHTKSRYAKLAAVEAELQPLLDKHGFSTSTSSLECTKPGHGRYRLRVRHVHGHVEDHQEEIPIIEASRAMNAVQAVGSANTYARRYLLCSVFNVIVDDDDDGVRAGSGPAADAITEQQADDLESLIEEVGANKAALCRTYGVKSIRELPAGMLRACVSLLEQKRAMRST